MEHLSSSAHVVHTTAKQVISRRRKNENVFKMSKDDKCTCKACKNTVFHCQICKFVGFLLPSSSRLLKLPNEFPASKICHGQLRMRTKTKQTNSFSFLSLKPSILTFQYTTQLACQRQIGKQTDRHILYLFPLFSFSGCSNCSFHLCTPTRPVILPGNEKLVLAPYYTYYPTLEEHLKGPWGVPTDPNLWNDPLVLGRCLSRNAKSRFTRRRISLLPPVIILKM